MKNTLEYIGLVVSIFGRKNWNYFIHFFSFEMLHWASFILDIELFRFTICLLIFCNIFMSFACCSNTSFVAYGCLACIASMSCWNAAISLHSVKFFMLRAAFWTLRKNYNKNGKKVFIKIQANWQKLLFFKFQKNFFKKKKKKTWFRKKK